MAGEKAPAGSIPVKADPPVIYTANSAASLALFEGDPTCAPLEDLDLQ